MSPAAGTAARKILGRATFVAAASLCIGATPYPLATLPVGVCRGPDPLLVQLYPTAHANAATGSVELRFADSPFGVTVTPEGHHLYSAAIETVGLRPQGRALVVWAATPSLDRVQKLGTLSDDGTLEAGIAFNKFLVFVTAEASPDVERWAGQILLRGISPSGRMHTMAGHGPFQGESCAGWGFGPGAPPRTDSTP